MKVIFVTDLHGDEWKYDRLFEVAVSLKADIVINAGDMLPKHGELYRQGGFIASFLDRHFERFNGAEIYYLSYLGNDDLIVFDELFEETCSKYRFVVPLAQRKFDLNGYEFIGMNWVGDYPFRLKDRCRRDTDDFTFQRQLGTGLLSTPNGFKEIKDWPTYAKSLPTIEDELTKLVRPENMRKTIYVMHMPPARLGLDRCYSGMEVGSKAVHDFIEKNQPLLALHGHIHESPQMTGKWFAELDKTLCIQPGQLDDFTYVAIDLDNMQFEKYDERYTES
jgi:Icc-related predicted phosphoesterase